MLAAGKARALRDTEQQPESGFPSRSHNALIPTQGQSATNRASAETPTSSLSHAGSSSAKLCPDTHSDRTRNGNPISATIAHGSRLQSFTCQDLPTPDPTPKSSRTSWSSGQPTQREKAINPFNSREIAKPPTWLIDAPSPPKMDQQGDVHLEPRGFWQGYRAEQSVLPIRSAISTTPGTDQYQGLPSRVLPRSSAKGPNAVAASSDLQRNASPFKGHVYGRRSATGTGGTPLSWSYSSGKLSYVLNEGRRY